MKKTSLISCVLFVLFAGCQGDESDDVIAVRAEVGAVLSGDGMPADQRQKTFAHDELWLNLDEAAGLAGFQAHPWDLPPRQHSYDLQLEFAPVTKPGSTELVAARVCFVSCGDHPEKDGCEGPCFSRLESGTVDVRSISKDGKSFDIRFEFEVTDVDGRAVTVSGGSARTKD